ILSVGSVRLRGRDAEDPLVAGALPAEAGAVLAVDAAVHNDARAAGGKVGPARVVKAAALGVVDIGLPRHGALDEQAVPRDHNAAIVVHDDLGPVRQHDEPELPGAAHEPLSAGEIDLGAVRAEYAHAVLALDPVAAVAGDARVAVEAGLLQRRRVVGVPRHDVAVAYHDAVNARELALYGA